MSSPKLSVVLTSYNYGHFLPESLQAIVDQSFQPSEFIIVDDCSTDNSVEIIESFARKYPYIRLFRNKTNQGAINSFYKGFGLVTGDYLLVCSADDKVSPGLFEKSMEMLAQYPNAGLCCCRSGWIDEFGNELPFPVEEPLISSSPCYVSPDKALTLFFERGNWLEPNTIFWRLKAVRETDAFTRGSKNYLDAFALVLIPLVYGACYIPEPLARVRMHEKQLSNSFRRDPKVWDELVKPMENLMDTTFANKFPPALVKDLKKKHRYISGVMALNQLDQAFQVTLENTNNSLQTRSFFGPAFQFGNRLLHKTLYLITRGYLFFRLRRVNKYILIHAMYRLKDKLSRSHN